MVLPLVFILSSEFEKPHKIHAVRPLRFADKYNAIQIQTTFGKWITARPIACARLGGRRGAQLTMGGKTIAAAEY